MLKRQSFVTRGTVSLLVALVACGVLSLCVHRRGLAWGRERLHSHDRGLLANGTLARGSPIPVLGIPVFAQADMLRRLLQSIDYPVERIVIVHNGRHPNVTHAVEALRQAGPPYVVHSHPENIGVAGAWNRILDTAPEAPYYIIVNDDIAFRPGALRKFVGGIETHVDLVARGRSNRVLLFPSTDRQMWQSSVFSCFALLRHAVDVVGRFDVNLWPAYHEDADYAVRLARANLWYMLVGSSRVIHGPEHGQAMSGSQRVIKQQPTERSAQEYKLQQERHEGGSPYFALKWGHADAKQYGFLDIRSGSWKPTLYLLPFNDSTLPLSFVRYDPALRRCLQHGPGPCRYNHSLLPYPERVPHGRYDHVLDVWLP